MEQRTEYEQTGSQHCKFPLVKKISEKKKTVEQRPEEIKEGQLGGLAMASL